VTRARLVSAGWGALFVAVACASSDDEPARSCIPGQTRTCVGPGGCQGAQACLPDGQALSACDCGSNPIPEGAGPSSPGTSCTALEPSCEVPNRLGAACAVDADCGYGFSCWSNAARLGFPGGPANGYCTLRCTLADDCLHVDPGAACRPVDGTDDGICLRGCLSKDPMPNELKCLDRTDVICWSTAVLGLAPFDPFARQQGFCQPACGSDADCPEGFCDLPSGNCVDEPPAGAAIGAGCAVDADCRGGVCATPVGGASFCTASCVYGTLGCGFADSDTERDAVCAAPYLTAGGSSEGLGDVGSCLETCDATTPCTLPDWECSLGTDWPGVSGVCQFVGNATAGVAPASDESP
jgi:hypothetical protein